MPVQSLREKVFKSSFWSLLGSGGRQLFGFVVFIVLSRILSPQEFGLVAVAVAFIELIGAAVRLGITENLVCDSDLSEDSASTAFWLSALAGGVVSALIIIFAPLVATFFAMPKMDEALRWLAIIPFLQATSSVHEAMLQRAFNYKALALRTLNATIGSGVISIIMALMGCGIYSLIFQRVVSTLIINITIWSSVRWMPRLVCRFDLARKHLREGRPLLVSNLLGMAKMRIVDMIIGYFLGAAAVGYYRIAGKLHDFIVQFSIEPVVSVALPAFSQFQNDKEGRTRAYQKLTMLCGLLTFPIFMGTAVLAPEVTVLFFGPQWQMSGLLMQIICIASVSSTLDYFFRPMAIAGGQQELVSIVNFAQFVGMVVITTFAAQFDIQTVMFGYVLCVSVITGLTLYLLKKKMDIPYHTYVQSFYAPVIVSLTMAAAVYALKVSGAMPSALWLEVLSLSAFGGIFYVGGIYFLFPQYRKKVVSLLLPLLLKFIPRLRPSL